MNTSIQRLFDIPYYQLKKYPQENVFSTKINNQWKAVSIQEYIKEINTASRALLQLGIKPQDKVAVIVSNNRYEWHVLDMALMQIGAINVPLYATLSSKDYGYILNHSDAQYCFVSDSDLLEKVVEVKEETQLKDIYTFDTTISTTNWDSFLALGEDDASQTEVDTRKKTIQSNDLATIIYTSGTTGTPKGVMISHQNIIKNIEMSTHLLKLEPTAVRVLSYLPISHIFERFTTYYYQFMGFSVYFAESIEQLGDNIREVQPHFIPIVPRLLEKVYDKIIAKGQELTGVKKALFFWAVGLGEQYLPYGQNGWWYKQKLKIADKLIFSKWRAAMGNEILFMVSGSAPLQARLIQIFTAAGMPIFEGYGMTETSPLISLNHEHDYGLRIGTVGQIPDEIEVKIAEDGEILVKGPNVMLGYYKAPEETAKAIKNGYLHTGDIGEIDSDGFLKITDRKKEMFKTSGGKYIAPAVIENKLKQSGFIEQIMVIGEGQKMPAALIQLNYEFVQDWIKKHGYQVEEFHTDQRIIARIQRELDRFNDQLGKWEQIKKFELTPDPWTIEAGHLTPTLKLRRKIIKEKYKETIAHIYA
ncbi:AMP-dependent synthetase/ligase [Aquimarina rhabdastrellae]